MLFMKDSPTRSAQVDRLQPYAQMRNGEDNVGVSDEMHRRLCALSVPSDDAIWSRSDEMPEPRTVTTPADAVTR